MKSLIITTCIIAICVLSCNKKEYTKVFNIDKIDQLDIGSYEKFWGNEKIDTLILPSGGSLFCNLESNKGGIRYKTKNPLTKFISVSVFESDSTAVSAMEFRINNVADLIQEGNSDIIKELWWQSVLSPSPAIFVNKYNTIIELSFYDEFDEEIVYETANQIVLEIDQLSDIVE